MSAAATPTGVPHEAVLTVAEVARVLRCGTNVVYRTIASGELRAIRVGRSLRVSRVALIDFMGSDRREGAAHAAGSNDGRP
jgi:excisionase family DNA binding protein